jgi:hypothetical protein
MFFFIAREDGCGDHQESKEIVILAEATLDVNIVKGNWKNSALAPPPSASPFALSAESPFSPSFSLSELPLMVIVK